MNDPDRLIASRNADRTVMGGTGRIYNTMKALKDRSEANIQPVSHGIFTGGRGNIASYVVGDLDGPVASPLRVLRSDSAKPYDIGGSSRNSTTNDQFAAVMSNGRCLTWGNQIGRGAGGASYVPGYITGNTWRRASCGDACTLLLRSDGTIWTFGTGTAYRTGQNSTSTSTSPVQIGSGLGVTFAQICLQGATGYAVSTTGVAYTWGNNTGFATGMGTSTGGTTVPTVCTALSGKIVKQITGRANSGGSGDFWAILANGQLWYTTGNSVGWAQIGSDTDWDWASAGAQGVSGAPVLLRKTNGDYYGLGSNNTTSSNCFGSVYTGSATSPQKLTAVSTHGFSDGVISGTGNGTTADLACFYVKPDGTFWGVGKLTGFGFETDGSFNGTPMFLGYCPPTARLQNTSYGFLMWW